MRAAVERLAQSAPLGGTGTKTGTEGSGTPERGDRIMVRLAGVEPATLGLEGRRSIQLSYRRMRVYTALRQVYRVMC